MYEFYFTISMLCQVVHRNMKLMSMWNSKIGIFLWRSWPMVKSSYSELTKYCHHYGNTGPFLLIDKRNSCLDSPDSKQPLNAVVSVVLQGSSTPLANIQK